MRSRGANRQKLNTLLIANPEISERRHENPGRNPRCHSDRPPGSKTIPAISYSLLPVGSPLGAGGGRSRPALGAHHPGADRHPDHLTLSAGSYTGEAFRQGRCRAQAGSPRRPPSRWSRPVAVLRNAHAVRSWYSSPALVFAPGQRPSPADTNLLTLLYVRQRRGYGRRRPRPRTMRYHHASASSTINPPIRI
jgi:hypothetical protein